jgi:hypothetical protein
MDAYDKLTSEERELLRKVAPDTAIPRYRNAERVRRERAGHQ